MYAANRKSRYAFKVERRTKTGIVTLVGPNGTVRKWPEQTLLDSGYKFVKVRPHYAPLGNYKRYH